MAHHLLVLIPELLLGGTIVLLLNLSQLVERVKFHNLVEHLFKSPTFILTDKVLPFGLVGGELDDLISQETAFLLELADVRVRARRLLLVHTEDFGEGRWLDGSEERGGVAGADQLAHAAEAATHGRVEVVLDGVVGAPWEFFGNEGPPVAEAGVQGEEPLLLGLAPPLLGDAWDQVVVPPLPALLAGSPFEAVFLGHALGDLRPVLGVVLLREFPEHQVFLSGGKNTLSLQLRRGLMIL